MKGQSSIDDLGFDLLGPLLLGMTKWIAESVRERPVEEILFLSRDGWLLEKAYNLLRKEDQSLPPSRYLLASRRALRLATLPSEPDEDILRFLLSGNFPMPLSHYLERVGLKPADCSLPIPPSSIITPRDQSLLQEILVKVWPKLLEISHQESLGYRAYLKETGITGRASLGLVDLGWHGSLQKLIRQLLTKDHKAPAIHGYYLGLQPDSGENSSGSSHCQGFLFDQGNPPVLAETVSRNAEVPELLFSEMAPGLRSFTLNPENQLHASREDYSISPESQGFVSSIQKDAIRYMETQISSQQGGYSICRESLQRRLLCFLLRPPKKHARELGRISFSDSFGPGQPYRMIAHPPSEIQSVLTPWRLVRSWKQAHWREAYFVQLGPVGRTILRWLSPVGYAKVLRQPSFSERGN